MNAVSNSSVLIALSRIQRLALLPERFPGGVIVPKAVWQEVVVNGSERFGADAIAQAKWITVQAVHSRDLVGILSANLDLGEAEAIALALETKPGNILLDEKAARQAARRVNLPTLGTVGLLIWAKKNSLISSLSNELDNLTIQGQFHIGSDVRINALRAAGELE